MAIRFHGAMRRALPVIWFALIVSACVQLAGYDQQAYENATTLKAATLAMLEKSSDSGSFVAHQRATDTLLVSLSAAYEYANGIEHNNEAAKNWRDLIGDDDTMIKGWLKIWRTYGSVSEAILLELREQLAEGFDTIICLEANKRELSSCDSLKRSE